MSELFARIHSIETCGTVDGPGVRMVVFMQGCCLRCSYCHNPDTWEVNQGEVYFVEELVTEIIKYKSYMRFSGGGVTISGGEPLLQADFLKELFVSLKKHGIHCALDTSGCILNDSVKELLSHTDLVLLDYKTSDSELAKKMNMADPEKVFDFIKFTEAKKIPLWLRHVLIPGVTNSKELLKQLAKKIAVVKNIEKVEILPFHKIGEYKWQELGIKYELQDIPPASKEDIDSAKQIFSLNNIAVF